MSDTKMTTITIRVSESEKAALDKDAASIDMTLSQFIRYILSIYDKDNISNKPESVEIKSQDIEPGLTFLNQHYKQLVRCILYTQQLVQELSDGLLKEKMVAEAEKDLLKLFDKLGVQKNEE